ncbi:hypothetical protein Q7P37_005072 [Cladosporium fusiforme]
MQFTQVFLALATACAVSAMQIPPHCRGTDHNPPCNQWTRPVAMKEASTSGTEPAENFVHLERRDRQGAIDDLRMKAICKKSFNSDKTKYKDQCTHSDNKDSCKLHALLDDATPECKKAMLTSLGF